MRVYNSLTKKLELFRPLKPKQVRVYSCGPTVYDHIHIGNLSSFIFADTLRRTLKAEGNKVHHVMNFTDVDDKTIRRSQEKYPTLDPLEALSKLTHEYIDVFLKDMAQIGNIVEDFDFVAATDSINDIKQLISELHQADMAYVADDGVYFSIEKYQASGKKYGQLLNLDSSNTSSARINNDEYDKDSAHDFALWKKQKDHEPAWDFELAGIDLKGRPGWHIECSAMSRNALGQPFDIHTGGVDLIFPHHENEIAQSTAAKENAVLARYFLHNEFLLVDGKKMSKSLSNFYTLDDIKKKGFEPLAFRLLVLQGHYRNQLNFTWEALTAAQNRLQELRAWSDLAWQLNGTDTKKFDTAKKDIQTKLGDDIGTPAALAALSVLVDLSDLSGNQSVMEDFINYLDEVFGLCLRSSSDLNNEQKDLIKKRQVARESKDWTAADKIRDQLHSQGIAIRDTDDKQIWSRLVNIK